MCIRDRAMQVRRDFRVNREPARPGPREILEVLLGLHHHQMYVDGEGRQSPYRLDHLRAEREVRDEAAVHDVDVNDIRTARFALRDVLGEAGEVGAENRWGYS